MVLSEESGGDSVCWLSRLCAQCGAMSEGPLFVCWRCGAVLGEEGAASKI